VDTDRREGKLHRALTLSRRVFNSLSGRSGEEPQASGRIASD